MGSTYVTNPVIFLIDTLFSLYILAVVMRFLLQWTGAEYKNPISQFLVKITHPPLKFLRRYIPSIGKIDTSSVVFALLLQMAADYSILLLKSVPVGFGSLAILSLTQLISLLINIFIFAVIARAILSWISPGAYNPATSILYSLTEPLLNACRRIIPDLGGMDLSTLIALLGLQLAKMLVLPPLQQLTVMLG
jgi:YggT family protein